MNPSIETLSALWTAHTAEQFRTWHEQAMRAAWEAGRDAAIRGEVPACKLCGKPLAYPGAVYCGAACCARWEGGERP